MMRAQEEPHVQQSSLQAQWNRARLQTFGDKADLYETLGTGTQAITNKVGQKSAEEHVASRTHKGEKCKVFNADQRNRFF